MFAHPDAVVTALSPEMGMKVVDLGSGSAMHMPALSISVGPNGRVYLVDIQKDLLDRARSRASSDGFRNVDFIWADIEHPRSTNLAEESVGRVLASHLLFQLDNPEAVFVEAFRILNKGGKLLVVDWSTPPQSIGGKIIPELEARKMAISVGFSEPKSIDVGSGQYAFLTEKPR